jgi:anti-anti-sigma factor
MLKATTLKIADTTFVRCEGKIVVGEDFDALQNAVLKVMSAKLIVLDLAGVKHIDAAGLSVLLGLRQRARAHAIQFKLMNVRPKVEGVLRLTKLDGVFEFWSARDMLDLMRITDMANAIGGWTWVGRNAEL